VFLEWMKKTPRVAIERRYPPLLYGIKGTFPPEEDLFVAEPSTLLSKDGTTGERLSLSRGIVSNLSSSLSPGI